jgi:hypothetical protein
VIPRPLGPALIAATLGLVPVAARAAPPTDAKSLFTLAREMRARGDCTGALPIFRSVYVIYPAGLGSLRNIAECEEDLGQRSAAHATWLELGRALGAKPDADAKYDGWADDAARGAERTAPAKPEPPERAVAARSVGAMAMHEAPQGGGPSGESSPGDERSAPPRSDGAAVQHTAAWSALGVGAAALLGAGVALIVRQNALDDLAHQCPNYQASACPDSTRSTVDQGQTASVTAAVLAAVGAAGVATGVILWATAPRQGEQGPKTAVRITPGGLLLAGSF